MGFPVSKPRTLQANQDGLITLGFPGWFWHLRLPESGCQQGHSLTEAEGSASKVVYSYGYRPDASIPSIPSTPCWIWAEEFSSSLHASLHEQKCEYLYYMKLTLHRQGNTREGSGRKLQCLFMTQSPKSYIIISVLLYFQIITKRSPQWKKISIHLLKGGVSMNLWIYFKLPQHPMFSSNSTPFWEIIQQLIPAL